MKRREFLVGGAVSAGVAALGAGRAGAGAAASPGSGSGKRPIAISSRNGLRAVETAIQTLGKGGSTLDAVIAGVNRVEEDPDDITVGYGGLPNERGEVELDACVMDGTTGRAGAVGALKGCKYPSRVARLVMEQTDHVLLTGEGAAEFARAQGFPTETLLTERSRKIWLWWKQTMSPKDDWIAPPESQWPEEVKEYARTYGTVHCSVHCSALAADGAMSCVTTTSGLFFKMPGRVGDSPIVGAGLYVDQDVGSCGSTGRGEEVILSCGSSAVVEQLRAGRAPVDAALAILERIVDRARKLPRLLKADGTPDFDVNFLVLDKNGNHAGAGIWSGGMYSIDDGSGPRQVESAYLLKSKS